MRIHLAQLSSHLERAPAPVYLVCGDEPLQLGEAADRVRAAARRHGFEEREILEADANFDWGRLVAAAQAMSLFASRKVIELRVTGTRLGRDGGEALVDYCARPVEDNLVLILAPVLEYKELKAKWVQAVERAGVMVQVRPVEAARLPVWIEQRLRVEGLVPGPGVAALIAERVEGNLLAAAQEIEKLVLLHGEGPLDAERLASSIADSSRYDLFDVPAAALAGDRARMHRVLDGLAAEGVAPSLVLWAVAREVRMLAEAAFAARRGPAALKGVFEAHRVWESRKGPVRAFLKRMPLARLHALVDACADVDRQIKGLSSGDPWLTLERIGDELAGGSPVSR